MNTIVIVLQLLTLPISLAALACAYANGWHLKRRGCLLAGLPEPVGSDGRAPARLVGRAPRESPSRLLTACYRYSTGP